MADDYETRLTLLERTFMSREAVIEREEKLLDRIDALMGRHQKQADQTLEHTLKVFGHDMGEQLQKMRTRINEERDEKLNAAVAKMDIKAADAPAPVKTDMLSRWGLPLGVAALVGGPGTAVQVMNLLNALF